jgi:hypothetical protein
MEHPPVSQFFSAFTKKRKERVGRDTDKYSWLLCFPHVVSKSPANVSEK